MPYLIIIGIVAGLLSGSWYYGYQHGKKIERAEWLGEKVRQDALLAKELGEAMATKAKVENENTDNLMRIINEKDAALDKLNADLAHTRGLYIRTKNTRCPANTVPGKAKSSGEPGSGAGRIELHPEDAANIRRDYADAQRVVVQYESCRRALLPLVEVVE